MILEFSIIEEDYINFNIHHMDISKTYRRTIFKQRYIIPMLFLIIPFFLVKISKIPFLNWMVPYGLLYITWACFYKKYLIWKVKNSIKKRLKEGKNNGILGKRTFEICEDEIIEISEYGKSATSIKSVEDVFINDKYIYIYINSMQAYIVPVRAFISKKEKDEFIKHMEFIKSYNIKKIK